MKPLYAARIDDLGPSDFVKVECTACGHTEPMSSDMLRLGGCPLSPYTGILDLEPKLRCRECDARGKAVCQSNGLMDIPRSRCHLAMDLEDAHPHTQR